MTKLRSLFASAIDVAIHKVINHLDIVSDVQLAQGTFLQILRYRSYSIALLDGKARDRKIRTVKADEGDVRAVQGRNERKPAPSGFRGEHLPREQRAYRVRNRIVNVQKVEIIEF